MTFSKASCTFKSHQEICRYIKVLPSLCNSKMSFLIRSNFRLVFPPLIWFRFAFWSICLRILTILFKVSFIRSVLTGLEPISHNNSITLSVSEPLALFSLQDNARQQVGLKALEAVFWSVPSLYTSDNKISLSLVWLSWLVHVSRNNLNI